MVHSYLAYIDESGDDGLDNYREPGRRGGSSTWLVISACIFRYRYGLEAVAWRDDITKRIPEKKSRALHFKELNHQQKVVVAQQLITRPIRAMSILAAKRPIPEGIYTDKNQLYFYMTRYLIERISWFCRDWRRHVPEGDGRVAITFSRRGGMSYEDFQAYLHHLRRAVDQDVQIHWPVIDIDGIKAMDHSRNAGLQLADAVASSFAAAVEPNYYGNCELRYAEILKPATYERNRNYLSYGVKIVPPHEECDMDEQQMQLVGLFR